MIRIEYTTMHPFRRGEKSTVSHEATLAEAKAHIKGLEDAGVNIRSAFYYDKEARVDAIRAGRQTEPIEFFINPD